MPYLDIKAGSIFLANLCHPWIFERRETVDPSVFVIHIEDREHSAVQALLILDLFVEPDVHPNRLQGANMDKENVSEQANERNMCAPCPIRHVYLGATNIFHHSKKWTTWFAPFV